MFFHSSSLVLWFSLVVIVRECGQTWRKMQCYECGGISHKRGDHREKRKRDKIEIDKKEDKKEIAKEKIEKDEIEKKKDKKEKKEKMKKRKSEKKKIERKEIGIETEKDKIVEEKREMFR